MLKLKTILNDQTTVIKLNSIFVTILLISSAFLCGCQTDVAKFYVSVDPNCEIITTEKVRLIRTTNDPTAMRPIEMQILIDEGYVRIGNCSFVTTTQVTEEMMIKQAEKVGAGAVIYYSFEPVTTTYDTVIPIYNQGQTYNSNYSGIGPAGRYSGTVTTTGPSSVSMMPARIRNTTQEWVMAFMAKKR